MSDIVACSGDGRGKAVAKGIALIVIGSPVLLMGVLAITRIAPEDFDTLLVISVTALLILGTVCEWSGLRLIVSKTSAKFRGP